MACSKLSSASCSSAMSMLSTPNRFKLSSMDRFIPSEEKSNTGSKLGFASANHAVSALFVGFKTLPTLVSNTYCLSTDCKIRPNLISAVPCPYCGAVSKKLIPSLKASRTKSSLS